MHMYAFVFLVNYKIINSKYLSIVLSILPDNNQSYLNTKVFHINFNYQRIYITVDGIEDG
jgi:hypothetical protein